MAMAAWAALHLVRATRDGREGIRLANAAADAAVEGALTDPGPLADLRRSQGRFVRARNRLHALPLRGVGLLPVLGRQVHEVQRLSEGAVEVADISADSCSRRRSRWRRPLHRRPAGGPAPGPGRRGRRRGSADGRDPPHHGPQLVGPVRERHDEFGREVDRLGSTLTRAAAGATATAELLGAPAAT